MCFPFVYSNELTFGHNDKHIYASVNFVAIASLVAGQ